MMRSEPLVSEVIARRSFFTGLLGIVVSLVGLRIPRGFAAERAYKLAPESALPADIRRARGEIREAYRFAIANRDILRYIPCYCGCGAEGHTSNASCYLHDSSTSEKIIFDRMSLGWGICINITRDVMRGLDERKSLKEIRTYIDQTYGKYGPPTPTPPVP